MRLRSQAIAELRGGGRLELLRALADSLQPAESLRAMASGERLLQHSARQRELCRELHALVERWAGGAGEAGEGAEDLQEAVRRVRELNRNYAALLRRRRRTVDIFCRVLASAGTTYPAPPAAAWRRG